MSPLTEGDYIVVEYPNDADSARVAQVWKAWPQIAEFDRSVAKFTASGGELGLRGYNFATDTTVTLVTPTNQSYELSVTFVDSENLVVDLPVLPANEQGACSYVVRSPEQPSEDGASAKRLLTCDADNIASRKVIEACGGKLAECRDGRCWYWVATG